MSTARFRRTIGLLLVAVIACAPAVTALQVPTTHLAQGDAVTVDCPVGLSVETLETLAALASETA